MTLDRLRIYLFGEPHLEIRGEAHSFKAPPKTLPLLAYVLLHRRAAIARETVAAALWPDDDQATAFGNLRRHLHYLGKALPAAPNGAAWLLTDNKSIAWNMESPYWLDIEAFETESQDRQLRSKAVRLYSGDLYERCSEEWIDFERERLRTLQISNLAHLCTEARDRSSYIEALQYAQLMLAADPWREDAVRAIMETRMLLGDRAGALAEYERFASRLQAELHTSPLAETTAAYTRIARSLESGAAESAQAPGVALVGRRNELAMLRDQWQRAARGEGRAVFLGGEAGIGKSTLLQALCDTVSQNDGTALAGASSPQEDTAYAAFLGIAHAVGTDLITPVSSDDERLRGFESFAAALEARARSKPLLVTIEDLHWAGRATLDLLRYLVLRLARAPVLFVGTYREFEVTRGHPLRALRRQLTKMQRCSSIALSSLTREEVRELAALRAGRRLTDEFVSRIYERSDGNPLFVIELVREMRAVGHDRIPASIAGIVTERMARLEPGARGLLQTASLAGSLLTAELLAHVTGMREGDVLALLDELVASHFLRHNVEESAFSFVHEVIREAVLQGLAPRAVRSTHARIAFALRDLHEEDFGEVAATVARHFEGGGISEHAATAYLVAAEQALEVYAIDEAGSYAKKALEFAGTEQERIRALCVLESVAGRRAHREEQRGYLQELLRICEHFSPRERAQVALRDLDFSSGESPVAQRESLSRFEMILPDSPDQRPAYLLRLGEYLSRVGEAHEAKRVLQQALHDLSDGEDPVALVRCLTGLYTVFLTTGDSLDELQARVNAARANLEQAADARLAARLAFIQCGASIDRDPQLAGEFAHAMLEHAQSAGDVWLQALAHRSCGACATRRMLLDEAQQHFLKCADITIAAGRHRDLARVRDWQVMLQNRFADFEAAEHFGADGLQAAIAADAADLRTAILANLANTAMWAGDLDTAEARLRESIALGEQRGYAQPSISSLLGEVLIGKGDLSGGIALIERASESGSPQDGALKAHRVHVPVVLGLAYFAAGRTQDGLRYARQVRSQIDAFETYYIHPQVYLWSGAQLLALCGYGDDAAAFLEAAQRRRHEILRAIGEAGSRERFCRFIFNQFIESGTMVDDPLHAWFLPRPSSRRLAREQED